MRHACARMPRSITAVMPQGIAAYSCRKTAIATSLRNATYSYIPIKAVSSIFTGHLIDFHQCPPQWREHCILVEQAVHFSNGHSRPVPFCVEHAYMWSLSPIFEISNSSKVTSCTAARTFNKTGTLGTYRELGISSTLTLLIIHGSVLLKLTRCPSVTDDPPPVQGTLHDHPDSDSLGACYTLCWRSAGHGDTTAIL